ncbi:MAG TPA: hypothetical protein VN032_04220 [Thermoanaerobaculia bacterium]|nr:hypothetical protein [Thermoanaerobaculia bacterium]
MTTSRPLSQYLSRHAEPEAALADGLEGSFGHVVVVPAYGEGQSLFDTLGSVPKGPRGATLIVVVFNARDDSPARVHEVNHASSARLFEAAKASRELGDGPPVSELAYPNGTIVVIDRARPGHFLPEGQGVGLARKIGNDFALRLHETGRIASPWIHNTDADTVLANDCFEQTEAVPVEGSAAALYFFEHRLSDDEDLALAARLYEISLRYYVLGLAWAGSPYAYEAMGSCVAIRPEAYAAVRGFPRKNAAEDFYVLDKLAKVGTIARLAGTPFLLEGRISDRVPFGTGKALSQLLEKKGTLSRFRLHHPAAFAHLSAWLRALGVVARSGGRIEAALEELPRGNPFFKADVLVETLERMGAFEAMRAAVARSSDAPTMLRHFHTWFDAFRTLKLLRALQARGLPALPWQVALAEAPFTGLSASTQEDPESLRRALAAEERTLAATPAGVPAVVEG